MKSFIAMASMLLSVFAVQGFGFAFGAEQTTANDSINASQMNETLNNGTLINGTLENGTLINGTLENATLTQNDSDPFANAKNRQPKNR
ncbi:MAG: hypothetical protein NTY37_10480 [Methanothrix sp.]|nr:hypothetical protein [Methanothrix sp.]